MGTHRRIPLADRLAFKQRTVWSDVRSLTSPDVRGSVKGGATFRDWEEQEWAIRKEFQKVGVSQMLYTSA